ncbi:glycerophosphodiester phosphodiesterase [Castellaniella sp.]|uniref:glycerophosphodiester phosphodiesterase n=1 Tax=Castellaniella sp. TaxID=1955812 RepID=UPI00355F3051
MTAPHPAWPWPDRIAHRGGGTLAPENTLAAVRAGAASGFRMVEFDVKLSVDGIPFLLHDDDVARTSNGRGLASTLTWADLGQMDFGSWHSPEFAGEPAPALYAVARYALAQGLHCNIEIKPETGFDARTGQVVAAAARQWWAGAGLPPLLSSFSETALMAAREAAPELPRALLIDGPVPADWRTRVHRVGAIGLNLSDEHADAATLRRILAAGATVAVWTINDAARASEVLSWGCQAVFTDALHALRTPLG